MTELSAGEIMRRWFEEVWNRRDPGAIPRYMAADCVCHAVDESGADLVGPEAFSGFHRRILSSFSAPHFTLNVVIESGPLAAARWSVTMTHDGDGLGVAPTGRRLTLSGMSMLRAEGGLVHECWDEWNRLGMATGLGLVVTPG